MHKSTIFLLICLSSLLIAVSCAHPKTMPESNESDRPTADELFQAELAERGLEYTLTDEGLYQIVFGDVNATINLDNIRRNYERDKDRGAVSRFAEQLAEQLAGDVVTLVTDACATKSQVRHDNSLSAIHGYCRQRTSNELIAEITARTPQRQAG